MTMLRVSMYPRNPKTWRFGGVRPVRIFHEPACKLDQIRTGVFRRQYDGKGRIRPEGLYGRLAIPSDK